MNSTRTLTVLLLVFFVVILIRNAWVTDDAYITFRTVDNFIHGYGLTWNLGERVQSYTHPLWMFLVSLGYSLTREIFFTVICLSILVSLTAVALLAYKIADTPRTIAVGLLAFMSSKSFIDFTTSGLENPLTYLLTALFMLQYLKAQWTSKTVLALTLSSSLLALNRIDTFLLVLPAVSYALFKCREKSRYGYCLLGLAPLLLWEIFSFFYYGSFVPNTAYAKLNTSIPKAELLFQGMLYLLNSLHLDPITLLLITAMVVTTFVDRNLHRIMIAIGIVLYLLYVLKIGGDFMSGRFLAAPFFAAVILMLKSPLAASKPGGIILLGLVVFLNFVAPYTPLKSDASYGLNRIDIIDEKGIADERAFYYQTSGLLKARGGKTKMPYHPWARQGTAMCTSGMRVGTRSTVGYFGFFAGPAVHIVDLFALADPLLARLPASVEKPKNDPLEGEQGWRIGHFWREPPPGYLKTLSSKKNWIVDAHLAAFYDKLSFVITGPLWDWNRIKEAWNLNTGKYQIHIDAYLLHPTPLRLTVSLSELTSPKITGTPWDEATNFQMEKPGIEVNLGSLSHARQIEVSLDHNDAYEISYFRDTMEGGKQQVLLDKLLPPPGGLAVHKIIPPAAVSSLGFDRILIKPAGGDGRYSIGHLKLL